MTAQVETDRLERVLKQLDEARSDFSAEEQALFGALMQQGLKEKLPGEVVAKAEAEASSESGEARDGNGEISTESAEKVAQTIMRVRDEMSDDEDKKLIDSLIVTAAAPDDEDEVEGHVWTFKWEVGAPTNSYVYSYYRSMCNRTASITGGSGYLQANFGTFWTKYRCYVWN